MNSEDTDVVARYLEKITNFCEGIDPYILQLEKTTLPTNVGYFDVVNYCIGKDSAYTHETFKAYKSLKAYEYYENGWVQAIQCKKNTSGCIVIAKVKHSYRLNLKPLHCWIAIDESGIVLAAHCLCMAGLGEVCTHIGATLFVLEAWNRKSSEIDSSESISCTDVLSKWLVPRMKTVEMATVADICWNPSPGTSKDDSIDQTFVTNGEGSFSTDESLPLVVSDEAEIDSFLHKLKALGVSCPIMAVREPFSSNYVPKTLDDLILDLTTDDAEYEVDVINLYLTAMFDPKYKYLPLEELQTLGEDVELSYTQEQIDFIEEKTRGQSSSVLWYRFRAGRVTGSVFKAVCRTSGLTPSISTIEKICFPERQIFTSKATEYGKQNETVALSELFDDMSSEHMNYEMKTTGLLLNNKYPFCGVSPDAIVTCDCCGKGVVEVKCPYLLRFGDMKSYLKKKTCPLIMSSETDSNFDLRRDHEYYYQVQMEMFVAEVNYCDFVVWCKKKIIRIRISKDEAFWNAKYELASKFFRKVLIPELFACYYTRMVRRQK